jgi:hypothetical protein
MKVTPFGGPGSGLWPSGSAAPSPGPRVLAQGAPTPSCTVADLFAQCFGGCDAAGNCGWTAITPPGTVTFGATKVSMGPFGVDHEGAITKPIFGVTAPNRTFQFKFTEVGTPPGVGISYSCAVTDAATFHIINVQLFGEGLVQVFVRNAGVTLLYIGTWAPVPGALRTVHLQVNVAGIPTLFIDGVAVALALSGPIPTAFSPNVVVATIVNALALSQGAFDSIFLATGIFPPDTVFCC